MPVVVCRLLAFLCVLVIAAPAIAQDSKPITLYEVFGVREPGLKGSELEAAVTKAAAFPLGSDQNPVRTKGPAGQRAYLARLRCSNGQAPRVLGRMVGPPSPFNAVIDQYGVQCDGAKPVTVSMDMYHEWVEDRAVSGFTIIAR
jgi:hypothetical protein